MFDVGVPELLRRFIVSTPLPPPPPPPAAIPFQLSYTSFETTNHFLDMMVGNKNHKIIQYQHQNHNHHDDNKDGGTSGWMSPMSLTDHDDDGDDDGVVCRPHHPWTSDEVHALLKLRSTMENWFTWEHISRKLTEVGFKRTPQECKEKFEEERRYFNIDNTSDDHIIHYNARMFSELEEFYRHGHDNHDDDHHEHVSSEAQEHNQNKRQKLLGEPRTQDKDKVEQEEDPNKEEEEEDDDGDDDDKMGKSGNIENEGQSSSSLSSSVMVMMMEKKRKRKRKGFEMLKGFCEGMVRSMIAQQEEMHKKILEDMKKRDEEKIAREEIWKKREMERINKELEIRAHEQALASDRNSTIIKFITKFTSVSEDHHHHCQQQQQHVYKVQSPKTSQSSSCLVPPPTPSSNIPSLSSSQTLTPHNPLYLKHTDDQSLDPISVQTLRRKTRNPITPKSDKNSDLGKRWPRDEVLALVNIRCRISTKINVNHHHREDHHHKDGPSTSKAPSLWERVSEKMLELGYDRSAKRCKEKWENINKYFKKTKNVNKKRPLDSRTCPYFHQLNELYNQGSLAGTNTAAGKVDSGCQYPETLPQ